MLSELSPTSLPLAGASGKSCPPCAPFPHLKNRPISCPCPPLKVVMRPQRTVGLKILLQTIKNWDVKNLIFVISRGISISLSLR